MTSDLATFGAEGAPAFSVNATPGFAGWLGQQGASLAVTTYQVGKLIFIGVKPDGQLWVFNRNVGRCLGLAVDRSNLWAAAETRIYKFVDAKGGRQDDAGGADALYLPQMSYITGDLDIHDLAVMADGTPIFVNTVFNCLATVSTTHSFVPVWKPPFISRLVAEDRCHLNGLAMRDGEPAFVTAVNATDTFDGWRDGRSDGGIVIDVASDQIVCEGLSMPHSPRWFAGKLWLHNSGTGEFGWLDFDTGKFRPLCFVPGFLRGLDFIGNTAVMGLSKPRDNRTFSGLALDTRLSERRMEPRCGLQVVDLGTGDMIHSLAIDGIVSEVYDIAVLPGLRQPAAIGPGSPDLRRTISIGEAPARHPF